MHLLILIIGAFIGILVNGFIGMLIGIGVAFLGMIIFTMVLGVTLFRPPDR